jgi:hypothetical protein
MTAHRHVDERPSVCCHPRPLGSHAPADHSCPMASRREGRTMRGDAWPAGVSSRKRRTSGHWRPTSGRRCRRRPRWCAAPAPGASSDHWCRGHHPASPGTVRPVYRGPLQGTQRSRSAYVADLVRAATAAPGWSLDWFGILGRCGRGGSGRAPGPRAAPAGLGSPGHREAGDRAPDRRWAGSGWEQAPGLEVACDDAGPVIHNF